MSVSVNPKVEAWINKYNTEKTREAATTSYNAIQKYLKLIGETEKEWIKPMKRSDDEKYRRLSEIVNDVSKLVEPASIKQYYNFWKAYLRIVHGIKMDNSDVRYFVKPPKNIKRIREPLTHETIKLLCKNTDPVHKARYLVLSSSGMRIGEMLSLNSKSYNLDTQEVWIHGIDTKTQTERKTFISKEAIEAIEKCKDEFFDHKGYHMEALTFWKLRNKIGLTQRYHKSIVHRTTLHSFRSFTRTQAGKINTDFAEKLIGHSGYLGQYVRIEDDDMFGYYEKLEPKLRIF